MAFDITTIDFDSKHRGIVFDHTDADATTDALIAWDTTSQKIYLEQVWLGCACGNLTLFDGSAGSMICSLVCVTGNMGFVTQHWDFAKDPVKCDGTGNVCISGSGVIQGTVKYFLGV